MPDIASRKIIDKLAWIYIHDRKVLSTRSFGKTVFYLPGGKREPGETDRQALDRELIEELQVILLSEAEDYFGTFEAAADGHPEGVSVRMTCYRGEPSGVPMASSEIEEVRWLGREGAAISSAVDRLVFATLIELDLID